MCIVAPRVYSFPIFTLAFCERLLEELEHFEQSEVPKGRPNTMNNTGVSRNKASTPCGPPFHWRWSEHLYSQNTSDFNEFGQESLIKTMVHFLRIAYLARQIVLRCCQQIFVCKHLKTFSHWNNLWKWVPLIMYFYSNLYYYKLVNSFCTWH